MFNFLHPRPLLDGRPVVVQIVQQKAVPRQATRLLIMHGNPDAPGTAPSAGEAAGNPGLPAAGVLADRSGQT